MDFGGLSEVKALLLDLFDHKTLVAADDPAIAVFEDLAVQGLIELRILERVGCESFAKHIFDVVSQWLRAQPTKSHIELAAVEVFEHEGNAARYEKD